MLKNSPRCAFPRAPAIPRDVERLRRSCPDSSRVGRMPGSGVAAGIGLVLFFVGAVVAHMRATHVLRHRLSRPVTCFSAVAAAAYMMRIAVA